jgi:TRAP-type mannitol/chloroaromatic compound transport system permease small subunit
MHELANKLESISEWAGRTISWLTVFMVAITFLVVVLRYLFDTGWIAMQESVTYMHAMVFLVGASYTLKHNGHVRVDIFYRKMSPQRQAWVDLLGTLFLLLPVCAFIFWASWEYVLTSWQFKESSGEAGGLPGVYLLKTLLLIMPALLILQGTAHFLQSLLKLRGIPTAPQEQPPSEL